MKEKYLVSDIKIVDDEKDRFCKYLYLDDLLIGHVYLALRKEICSYKGKKLHKRFTDTIGFIELLCSRNYMDSIGRSDSYLKTIQYKDKVKSIISEFLKPIEYLDRGTLVGTHEIKNNVNLILEKNGILLIDIGGILFKTDLYRFEYVLKDFYITEDVEINPDDINIVVSEKDKYDRNYILINNYKVISCNFDINVSNDCSRSHIVSFCREIDLEYEKKRAEYLFIIAKIISSLKNSGFYNLGFGSIMKYGKDGTVQIAIIGDNYSVEIFKFNSMEDYELYQHIDYDDFKIHREELKQFGIEIFNSTLEEFLNQDRLRR